MITISFCLRKKKGIDMVKDVDEISSVESLQFNFDTVRAATEDLCDSNKLGEGGFGLVYKGKLSDGQEITVKRLSRNSGRSVTSQTSTHMNLVRLLRFCLEGNEKLLIYEFVPNASLNQFLFGLLQYLYFGLFYMCICTHTRAPTPFHCQMNY
ncbi:hypothetical protein IFM89_007298 [Coptis chinensis]|uniref:Protein kinase domain-containing protein n=1 Tax=Coptis chinensis TaxID=261450 RepID=A0A835GY63_9MAGN|nr:hypothetical protein IFM89_007298 [Coptis chinensis]